MTISEKGKNLIKGFESCLLAPYKDVGGYLTIGWGHLVRMNEFFGEITQEEADKIFNTDIELYVRDVNRLLKTKVNQDQFDALVSLCYNIGAGNLKKSLVIKEVNANRLNSDDLKESWLSHNKCKGKVVQGLANRRRKELHLFLGE